MKFPCIPFLIFAGISVGSLVAQLSSDQRTLLKDCKVPLIIEGKNAGSISLPKGSEVTVLKSVGGDLLLRRGDGEPFSLPANVVSPAQASAATPIKIASVVKDVSKEASSTTGAVSNPILAITVDHAILMGNEQAEQPVSASLRVTPLNFPPDAELAYSWKQVQDVMTQFAAKVAESNTITFSPPDAASTKATITGTGVFEVRLTVTDKKHGISSSRNTWISVWNPRSPIIIDGKPDPLCVAPGILPPSVRNLSPDPGPFCHPRLFTTDRDWPELSARCRDGKIACLAVGKLKNEIHDHFENTNEPSVKLTDDLAKYAESGFQGKAPDLTMGIPSKPGEKGPDWSSANNKFNEYCQRLRNASLLSWIEIDPTLPRVKVPEESRKKIRRLAAATAGLCHVFLKGCWDAKTGVFHKEYPLFPRDFDIPGNPYPDMSPIGLSYDFTSRWMTPSELRSVRDFLYAQSAGRTTGARVVFFASGVHGRLQRGEEQNGDFMNIEECKILNALAVEGEESDVSPEVLKAFRDIPKPDDHEKSEDFKAYDWMQPYYADNKGACAESKPYSDACGWPNAQKVQIDNLQRAIWWNDDTYVSPWGFQLNKEAYYGFSAWGLWPMAVAWAIHGAENQYVTGLYYQTVIHLLYSCYQAPRENKSDNYSSHYFLFDHHDGGGDYRQNHVVLMKYMYPDDPAVDYIYAGNAPELGFNPFILALFGLDPGIKGKVTTLEDVGLLKKPVLTKVDPQQGFVVARTGWGEEDLMLHFDEGWHGTGHMHAEKGNFSLFALGRPWSFAPGYHVTDSTWQSEVLIQDPRYAGDTNTQGYMGEGPNLIPEGSDYKHCFPTPPGKLFQVIETPDKSCVIMVGDNATAYSYSCGPDQVETPMRTIDYLYPGLADELNRRDSSLYGWMTNTMKLTTNYFPVQYAYRTILFAKGKRPYVLILDDINKDGTPRNYRWQMNGSTMFGPASLFMDAEGKKVNSDLDVEPGATATDAILLHTPLDKAPKSDPNQAGLPRLLVRDLSEVADANRDPVITVNKQAMENNKDAFVHRVFISRNDVVEPKYKVLLFPYRTGEQLPETIWNKDHTQVTIDLKNGVKDTITFNSSNPDHRTRVDFKRSGG